ncbi:MAG: hypothetical protein CM1200mP10_07340 [Candidatus Neomarinimicrobiota bacterium]|nr:MAG: hypothetical protein CM1200mP10_07340 [Candidatus Neomarinimicrobiota bacterium]
MDWSLCYQVLAAKVAPGSLGPGMSAALITTFYGAVFANLFFLPMADKINVRISTNTTLQSLLVEASRLKHQKKHP